LSTDPAKPSDARQIDQTNVIVSDANFNSHQDGEARSRGVEIEGVASLGLNLHGGYTLTATNNVKDVTTANKGKWLPQTPKNQVSALADYTQRGGRFAGLGGNFGVRLVGTNAADAANTFFVPNYTLLDARLRFGYRNVLFGVNATNLADKRYIAPAQPSPPATTATPATSSAQRSTTSKQVRMSFVSTFLRHPRRLFLRRAPFQIHLWAGVLLSVYVVVIALTGSILVFRSELQRATLPSQLHPYTPTHTASIETVLEQFHQTYLHASIEDLEMPSQSSPIFLLEAKDGPRAFTIAADPVTGAPCPLPKGWLHWIYDLHVYLLLGHGFGMRVKAAGAAISSSSSASLASSSGGPAYASGHAASK
jgi:hypothetical protein